MQGRPFQYVVYLCLFFGANARTNRASNLLQRVTGIKSSKPLVVILDLGKNTRTSDFDDLFNNDGDDGLLDDDDSYKAKGYETSSSDESDAYYLYHLLRDHQDQNKHHTASSSSSDSSSDESLERNEPVKQVLRTALRARCQKVDTCVRECPPRKPSCPINCQQVFDNLNLCPPPPPPDPCAKKPKCGRTMPPSWRF